MPKTIRVRAVIDLGPTLDVVDQHGVLVTDNVCVQCVVVYKGIEIYCESLQEAQELCQHAIERHAVAKGLPARENL